MNGVAAAERGVHSRQAVGEVAVAYPLTPQQLRAAVIESGCGEVKAPPEQQTRRRTRTTTSRWSVRVVAQRRR